MCMFCNVIKIVMGNFICRGLCNAYFSNLLLTFKKTKIASLVLVYLRLNFDLSKLFKELLSFFDLRLINNNKFGFKLLRILQVNRNLMQIQRLVE